MDVLDQLDQADTEHIEESLDENNPEDDRSNDNPSQTESESTDTVCC